jgi:PmbA protein
MIVKEIVKKAMEKADGAAVTMIAFETSEVDFKYDKLKSAESSQRTNIEVKVILDGKLGISNTTDPNEIEGVVNRALEAAEFGKPVNFEIPDAQALNPVEIFDSAVQELKKPEMIHIGKDMMEMVKSSNSEILADATVTRTISKREYANSKGAEYSEDHSDFYFGTGGSLIRGTDVFFAGYGLRQKKREVDTEEIAEIAIERFNRAKNIAPIKSAKMPVILTPQGVMAMLLSLGLAVDGKNVLLGASPLKDKLGTQIASELLTVKDDPFVAFGAGSSAVDNEGIARKVTPIVEKGILKNFIYDLDTAGKAGVQATGHGTNRDLTNIMVEPGDTPLDEMIKSIDNGLMAHSYLGLGQGNPINGDFSVNLFAGYKIENGQLVGRVKDVMLAGNAFEALMQISAISQEREAIGMVKGLSPYILVDQLSVIAK